MLVIHDEKEKNLQLYPQQDLVKDDIEDFTIFLVLKIYIVHTEDLN